MKTGKIGCLLGLFLGMTAQAAKPAEHFYCNAGTFFGRLKIEFVRTSANTLVNLRGLDGEEAATSLGMKKGETLQLEFARPTCTLSTSRLGVLFCQLDSTAWPPAPVEARSLDSAGGVVDRLLLSVAQVEITRVVRTHVGTPKDYSTEKLEAEIFLISEKENDKRASIQLPFELSECEAR